MLPAWLTRPLLLTAALPIASLLFACGGGSDKKVDMDDWVADLCDAAADFEDASDEAGEAFLDADFDDTKEVKKAFAESLEKQKDAQKDFRSAFNKLGTPDIDGGSEVIKAFKKQFDENDKLTKEVGEAVADIDNDDNFLEAFDEISADFDEPDFRAALEDVADDHDEVEDLIDAIDDDPDCSDTIFSSAAADEIQDEPTAVAGRTPTTTGRTPAATRTAAPATTTNEKWVSGICTSFSGWVNDLEKANTTFQAALEKSSGDGASIKRLLLDFLKLGQTETKNLQKEVSALKAPDVQDGTKIHKIFVDTAGELVKVFDTLVADANKISTTNPTQTEADVERLAASIDSAFEEAGAGFDQLDAYNAPALEKLFDSRPECQGF